VESRQGPGSGSTFTVRLPRRPAGASSAGKA
jgi:signal transduction histidine kinase